MKQNQAACCLVLLELFHYCCWTWTINFSRRFFRIPEIILFSTLTQAVQEETFSEENKKLWFKELLESPLCMWHTPSGQVAWKTQDWTKTVRLTSFCKNSREDTNPQSETHVCVKQDGLAIFNSLGSINNLPPNSRLICCNLFLWISRNKKSRGKWTAQTFYNKKI